MTVPSKPASCTAASSRSTGRSTECRTVARSSSRATDALATDDPSAWSAPSTLPTHDAHRRPDKAMVVSHASLACPPLPPSATTSLASSDEARLLRVGCTVGCSGGRLLFCRPRRDRDRARCFFSLAPEAPKPISRTTLTMRCASRARSPAHTSSFHHTVAVCGGPSSTCTRSPTTSPNSACRTAVIVSVQEVQVRPDSDSTVDSPRCSGAVAAWSRGVGATVK
mmetsp:Transcript_493/g.1493  ORF Transcript_493/g.1493 Transcript_493/m.1493 type:complete len:224 (+) Transcript_493:248-919(+)